jgi:ABC-type multidrug transport system ATPase subunit
MIELERVAARKTPLALARVSLSWGAGSHAIIGARADGGPLLLDLIAGRASPRSGAVRVLGGAPTDAAVRTRIAYVPLEPSLPEALRVHEALALAAAVRGEGATVPSTRLAFLGLETLADRQVGSLSRAEGRAVALCEAVSSSVVRVLLVEEPFVAMDPRAAARIPGVLRQRAADGCAIVVATASIRDAGDLVDDHVLMRRGAIVRQGPSVDALVGFWQDGNNARLRVVVENTRDAQALVAALAHEADILAIERFAGGVCARGRDPAAVARAAARAAIEAGVEVTELRFDPPSLDEARARAPAESSPREGSR